MPAIKKAFSLLGDDTVDSFTKNDALKNKKGCCDEKWLVESKTKLLKQINDENIANLFITRKKKQMNEQ